MADITALEKKVANSMARQATGFIRDNTNNFNNFGRIHGAVVNIEPVTDEPDTAGRDAAIAFDITGTFVMKQTSKEEIAIVGSLVNPDPTNYPNGHFIFFSDQPTNDPDSDDDGTPDVDGFGFANVLPKLTGEVNFSGEESMITIEFQGRVAPDEFDNFDTDPIFTFDA